MSSNKQTASPPSPEHHNRPIMVRVTDAQKTALQKAARRQGLPLGTWLRTVALQAAGKAALLLACVLTLAACSGGSPPPVMGACPPDNPIDCGAVITGGCCPRTLPVCCARDQNCYATQADCAGACQGSMGTCATSADCCAGLACGRIATFCRTPANLAVGDPCTGAGQCVSGLACDAVLHSCSRSCNDSAQCGAGTCLVTSKGFQCVAACSDDTDCAGTGLHCRGSSDPGGQAARGCF